MSRISTTPDGASVAPERLSAQVPGFATPRLLKAASVVPATASRRSEVRRLILPPWSWRYPERRGRDYKAPAPAMTEAWSARGALDSHLLLSRERQHPPLGHTPVYTVYGQHADSVVVAPSEDVNAQPPREAGLRHGGEKSLVAQLDRLERSLRIGLERLELVPCTARGLEHVRPRLDDEQACSPIGTGCCDSAPSNRRPCRSGRVACAPPRVDRRAPDARRRIARDPLERRSAGGRAAARLSSARSPSRPRSRQRRQPQRRSQYSPACRCGCIYPAWSCGFAIAR